MHMSLSHNRTSELWKSFMQTRKEIRNTIGTDLYSIQIYPPAYFENFNTDTPFEKFAGTEVSSFDPIPEGMEALVLETGLYAVFPYKGPASRGAEVFRHIYGVWLPASEYILDNRFHFEILGDKYKNEGPDSEEEIWIPVRPKQDQ